MEELDLTLDDTLNTLRASHLYPLPRGLEMPNPPNLRWKSREVMSELFGNVTIRMGTHRKLLAALHEVYRASHLAQLSGQHELATHVRQKLDKYIMTGTQEKAGREKKSFCVDKHGRALGVGRRKTSSARVWIIPSKSAETLLDQPTPEKSKEDYVKAATGHVEEFILPSAEILVNNKPLSTYFPRPSDRAAILRPLRLTGLLGAYNVFAVVQGGGITGQMGAVKMGLAKALTIAREDTNSVLFAG